MVDREEKKTHEWPTPATTKKLELSMRFIYFVAKSNEDYAKTTQLLNNLDKEKNP